jgi:undecaprenyl-diphosphatase
VGSVVSFLVALAVVAALMKFVQRHNFTVFGWYRIALAAVVVWYFFLM